MWLDGQMPNLSIRWRSRPDAAALERNIEELRMAVIRLKDDLTQKSGYAASLEQVCTSAQIRSMS
jgi:hypothetical protein